jgi:hypothetical protein
MSMIMFTFPIDIASFTPSGGLFDLIEINAPTDRKMVLTRLRFGQGSEAPADELQGEVTFVRGYTTGGSGGSAGEGQPCDPNNGALSSFTGGSVEVGNTTQASTSGTVVIPDVINLRQGYDLPLTPEEYIEWTGRLVVKVKVPTSLAAMSFRGCAWGGLL